MCVSGSMGQTPSLAAAGVLSQISCNKQETFGVLFSLNLINQTPVR